MAAGATSRRAAGAILVTFDGGLLVGVVDELPNGKVEIIQGSCGCSWGGGGMGDEAEREKVTVEENLVRRGEVDGDGVRMMGFVSRVEHSSK